MGEGDIDLTIPASLDRRKQAAPSLDELAHEINVRLQKADDHRLSASLKLAEAKAECANAGVSFKSWVAAEIKGIGYPEATKLAKIGAAPDPAKALADYRSLTHQRVKEHRTTKGVAYVSNSAPVALPSPGRGRAAICARVRDAIAILSGLPPASEVVAYLGSTDEAILVAENLPAAARWLAEFTDLWPEEATDAEAAE